MNVVLIFAISENGVIGNAQVLPWHLPEDLKFFRQTTLRHPVLMGRKTYFGLPDRYRPLPDRLNVVISRNPVLELPEGVQVFFQIDQALQAIESQGFPCVFVIGGAEIFQYFLQKKIFDKLYITRVHAQIAGDTLLAIPEKWFQKARVLRHHPADEQHEYAFSFCEILRSDLGLSQDCAHE